MTTLQDAQQFIGRTAVDSEGSKIGPIGQVYLAGQTGEPVWVTVTTGRHGTRQSFAPVHGSEFEGDQVRLAVSKDLVKDAPRVEADQELSEQEERTLFEHYGVPYTTEGSTTAQGAPGTAQGASGTSEGASGTAQSVPGGYGVDETGDRGGPGHDVSGPSTDDAMTRSEEELRVGTTQRESGRVRTCDRLVGPLGGLAAQTHLCGPPNSTC